MQSRAVAQRLRNQPPVGIVYEPGLMEVVVRQEMERRLEGDPDRRHFRRVLDEAYLLDGADRDAAINRVHHLFFIKLGWPAFFDEILAGLVPKVAAAGVLRADGDEGCFVDGRRNLQVRLRPPRFLNREALGRFLIHERMHAADILDPAFGYREEFLDGPTRIRYSKLWCDSVEARLLGRALEPVTHDALLQRAWSLSRPKCPICILPTAQWARFPQEMVPRLRGLFPKWLPEQGLCEHCLEWAELNSQIA